MKKIIKIKKMEVAKNYKNCTIYTLYPPLAMYAFIRGVKEAGLGFRELIFII